MTMSDGNREDEHQENDDNDDNDDDDDDDDDDEEEEVSSLEHIVTTKGILGTMDWFTTPIPSNPDANTCKPEHDYLELRFQWTMCYLFARDYIAHDK